MWEIALLLGVLFVGFLFTPITLRFEVHPETGFRVKSVTYIGTHELELRSEESPAQAAPTTEARDPKKKHSKSRAARKGPRLKQLLSFIRSDGLLPSARSFLRRLFDHLRPRDVDLSVAFGLGDPASTGRLWAALSPLVAFLLMHEEWGLHLYPDFLTRRFAADGEATIRIVPGVLLGIVVGYILSPTFLRALIEGARA